jgi:hypothetical protein
MIQLMFFAFYFLAVIGVLIFFLVVFWRAMRAHESIAESMKIIAEVQSTKVLAERVGNKLQA